MADITAGQLAKALSSRNFTVQNQHGLELEGGCYRADTLVTSARGELMFADALAESLLEDITGTAQALDNEIAALTVIVDRLEHLQPPTVQRVIRYLRDRYGTDG